MFILILGVALWWAAHLFKRAAPGVRARLGGRGKGIVALVLVVSVVLMVLGYRAAPAGDVWWGPSPMLKGINNVIMLAAVYLFAASGMKTAIARKVRHPQLLGFASWAFAHLLVNGDLPSLVLFGGLLVWAVVEMVVINAMEPDWQAPAEPAPIRKEVMAVIGTLVVFALIGLVHNWLGYNPFGT
ncbi:MAG: hypothetical protein DI616_00355 [Paracoccus denitrificans]|uniref:NnrU domain-containing protein n=1 Tax=Paracoccus denitrificans TaxID=266 RepID=A0A533ICI5_PARDE|nr:MAG: hypothetical protein DI616_00355 [Paracoccus denitrificans]